MISPNLAGHGLIIFVLLFLFFLIIYNDTNRVNGVLRAGWLYISLILFAIITAIDAIFGWYLYGKVDEYTQVVLGSEIFWVGFIGFSVGSVELIARYRDNPQKALLTLPAAVYIFVNVLACIAVLYALNKMKPSWLAENHDADSKRLYLILSAGFGAIALFRSSIFKIKTSDGELSVGPAILLDTLLSASDRSVDRIIAAPRGVAIAEIMQGVSFNKAKVALPTYCFALMQNVSHQEQKDIADQVNSLSASTMDDLIKSLNLGLALLNVVGEKVLGSAVKNLGDLIKGDVPLDKKDVAKVAGLMRGVNFDKAVIPLPAYCFAISSPIDQAVQTAFNTQVQALNASELSKQVKSILLGLMINNTFGFDKLELAISQLLDNIKD